jgi:hypothetical protein
MQDGENEMKVFMFSADSLLASHRLEDDICAGKKENKSISLLCVELLCASFMLFAIALGYVSVKEILCKKQSATVFSDFLSSKAQSQVWKMLKWILSEFK